MLIGGQSRDPRPAEWSGAARAPNRGELEDQEPEVALNRNRQNKETNSGEKGGRERRVGEDNQNKRKTNNRGEGGEPRRRPECQTENKGGETGNK